MAQAHIYILTGLGADKSVFYKLRLSNYAHTFVNWQMPDDKMSIEAYATLIAREITAEKPILVGLSFGGIVAIEIAKQIPVEKVILLATVKTKYEMPIFLRWIGKTKLHRIVPNKMFTKAGPWAPYFFGLVHKNDKRILSKILANSSPAFLKWAIDKILLWENTTLLKHFIHLHGSKDRLFPIRRIKNCATIKGAGHLLTLTHSDTLNNELARLLQ